MRIRNNLNWINLKNRKWGFFLIFIIFYFKFFFFCFFLEKDIFVLYFILPSSDIIYMRGTWPRRSSEIKGRELREI
jgi:hypothetical protein